MALIKSATHSCKQCGCSEEIEIDIKPADSGPPIINAPLDYITPMQACANPNCASCHYGRGIAEPLSIHIH